MNACTTVPVRNIWKDEMYRGSPFAKVLVIGIDPQNQGSGQSTKIFFEDEFAKHLIDQGVDAMKSDTIFSEDNVLEKRVITSKVKEMNIDAIVIISIRNVEETGTRTYPNVSTDEGFYGYYLQCCYQVSSGYNILIETRVYDGKYDTLIWRGAVVTVFSPGTFQQDTKQYFQDIITHLKADKLI